MKLEAKSKTHKTRKKTKCNIIKGSLCVIAGFLLVFITYNEKLIEKDTLSLITYRNNNLYTNVSKKELLNILDDGTGIIILINDKKSTNRIINLLYSVNDKEPIYLYNLKYDEIILKVKNKEEIKVEQEPSSFYKKLIERLGLYSENYILNTEEGKFINSGYKKIYAPTVLFIKDGKILLSHYILEDEMSDEDVLKIYKQGYEILNNGYNS